MAVVTSDDVQDFPDEKDPLIVARPEPDVEIAIVGDEPRPVVTADDTETVQEPAALPQGVTYGPYG